LHWIFGDLEVDDPPAVVGKNDHVLPATLLQRVFHKTIVAYNVVALGRDRARSESQAVTESGHPVAAHKFKVGQTVTIRPALSRNVPGGIYMVTKQLPENRGEFEYRIKGVEEVHERVARESELSKA
jgi:hypothetical protein